MEKTNYINVTPAQDYVAAFQNLVMQRLIPCYCFSILFGLTFFSTSAFGQTFRGSVRDATTKDALPYASIGIRGKNVGGISDENGTFNIDLAHATTEDTVVVSHIGYKPFASSVSSLTLSQHQVIELQAVSQLLKEIVVVGKPENVILGNKSKSNRHTGWGDLSSSRGRAIGLQINAPKVWLKVSKVSFHVDACEFDSARVRINFFKVGQVALESFASQTQDIVFTINKKRGWIEVPVDDNIVLRGENVVVAIEWIDAWAKPRAIDEGGSYVFTLSLAKAPGLHYIRQTPQEPIHLMSSGFTPSIYLECFVIRE